MEAHMRMEHNASGGGTLAGGRVAPLAHWFQMNVSMQ